MGSSFGIFLLCADVDRIFPDFLCKYLAGIIDNILSILPDVTGFEICANVKLIEVDGRRLVFDVEVNDGVDAISKGTHERFIINAEKFDQKMKQKSEKKH